MRGSGKWESDFIKIRDTGTYNILTLLNDEEWKKWSNVEIAKKCRVSDEMVRGIRNSLPKFGSDKPKERTYTTKHGTIATMNTEKIVII